MITSIYTLEDLVKDLWEIINMAKYRDEPVVVLGYDDLVLKIYRMNNRRVALRTIMKKLQLLERTKAVRVVQRRYSDGIVWSDKATVYIYRYAIKHMLPEQTIRLARGALMQWLSGA